MATNVLRDNSTDVTLGQLAKSIETLDISSIDSSNDGLELAHPPKRSPNATAWHSKYQTVAGDDKILAMFLLERDCKYMEFDEVSLMLAQQLSLLDPVDDTEIEQLVFDCYQELCMGHSEETVDDESSDMDICMACELLFCTPIGNPNRPELVQALGRALERRFAATGKPSNLNMAISCYYQAILLASPKGLDSSVSMHGLGNLCCYRFQHTGKIEDISQAITCYSYLASHSSTDIPTVRLFLKSLAGFLYLRFECTGEQTDIDRAIATQHSAISHFPDDHPETPECFSTLGLWYMRRHESFKALSDIEVSIEFGKRAISMTPDDHPDRSGRLCNLGNSYECRYERLGDPGDLELAISIHQQAVSLSEQDDECRALCFDCLGNSLTRQFERSGRVEDIEQVVACHIHAVELTPEGLPARAERINNLGNSYGRKFDRLGRLEDLEEAIQYLQDAAQVTPEDHIDYPERLQNLATSVIHRFNRLGNLEDLDRAINFYEEAMLLTPADHGSRHSRLGDLGATALKRFERLSRFEDLERSIVCLTESLALTPGGHITRPDKLTNLGSAFMRRFWSLGNIRDLDEAFSLFSEANQKTPEDDSNKATRLKLLARTYFERFENARHQSALDQAIMYYGEALALTPNDRPDLHDILRACGSALGARYELSKEVLDIDQAIKYHRQAVSLVPKDHPDRAEVYNSLGISLLARFTGLDQTEDIEAGVTSFLQSVELTPEHHSNLPGRLFNLGKSLVHRAIHLDAPNDFTQAASYYERAISLTPEGHASRASLLEDMGILTEYRYQHHTAQLDDLVRSIALYKSAALSSSGAAFIRLRAAHSWAKASVLLNGSPTLEAYARVMSLVPQVVWVGTTVLERYEKVPVVSGVVMEAVSAAITHGKYDLALEWLEEGRSIVWSQMTRLRTPMQQLHQVNPTLAEELDRVARGLDRAGTVKHPTVDVGQHVPSLEKAAQLHRRLAEQWDDLLIQVRQIPQFHNFLLPRKLSELVRAAQDRTIIVISVERSRCDALALLPGSEHLIHIPLPHFSWDKAAQAWSQLYLSLNSQGIRERGIRRDKGKGDNGFELVLALLWSEVAKPILDHLGYTNPDPTNELPHVTWCTTGPLAFLPLHAAGLYNVPNSRVFDFVVSSYTPTLSSLLAGLDSSGEFRGMLAVGQAATPGFKPLVYTTEELNQVAKHAADMHFTRLDGKLATTSAVLDAMERHSWVHLACHATQGEEDPTASAFHLHDGPLDLASIIQKPLPYASLAFLSACQTAAGDESLPEEAVHLAAGMIMAGYPSVIGTMWSIRDKDAPVIADRVYAELLSGGAPDSRRAARALHKATEELRSQLGEKAFASWVPYIHIGI